MMTALRFLAKAIYNEFLNSKKDVVNVVIYGADQFGVITKNTLERDESIKYSVVGYLDDKKKNLKKKIEGITIYGVEDLEEIIQKQKLSSFIFSRQAETILGDERSTAFSSKGFLPVFMEISSTFLSTAVTEYPSLRRCLIRKVPMLPEALVTRTDEMSPFKAWLMTSVFGTRDGFF